MSALGVAPVEVGSRPCYHSRYSTKKAGGDFHPPPVVTLCHRWPFALPITSCHPIKSVLAMGLQASQGSFVACPVTSVPSGPRIRYSNASGIPASLTSCTFKLTT